MSCWRVSPKNPSLAIASNATSNVSDIAGGPQAITLWIY